jgi:hypothetical protein
MGLREDTRCAVFATSSEGRCWLEMLLPGSLRHHAARLVRRFPRTLPVGAPAAILLASGIAPPVDGLPYGGVDVANFG